MKSRLAFLTLPLLLLTISAFVEAAETENLGVFRFSEFSLVPGIRLKDPSQGGFLIEKTWLGFEWIKDENLRGHLWLGSSDLTAPAIWYTPVSRPDFGVSEAFLEGHSDYGDLRAGLLNPLQGYEGVFPEWAWILPESQARRDGWLIKRDYGLQFRWKTKPFFTALTVHNGESAPNADGRYWYSGVWEYLNSEGAGVLITGSVGSTGPASTKNSTAPTVGFLFDPTDTAKIRYGTMSIFREDSRNLFLIEYGRGEILQVDQKFPYSWGRVDMSWKWSGDLALLLRYEETQSNLKDANTAVKSSSLGLSLWSVDRLQSLTMMATRHDQRPDIVNNEFLLLFRLNSKYLN